MKKIILALLALSFNTTQANGFTFNCFYTGNGSKGQFANQYVVDVDTYGTLLSVDGVQAEFIQNTDLPGEKYYRAGRGAFWYRSRTKILRRFEKTAQVGRGDGRGNFFYICH